MSSSRSSSSSKVEENLDDPRRVEGNCGFEKDAERMGTDEGSPGAARPPPAGLLLKACIRWYEQGKKKNLGLCWVVMYLIC